MQTGPSREAAVGEWNTYDITCRGKKISLSVNGTETVVWDDFPTTRGGVSYYPPGTMTVLGPVVALPEGRLHFCGEHTDAWQDTVEGAVRSGRRAAAEVIRRRMGAELAPWLVARQLAEHAAALGGE